MRDTLVVMQFRARGFTIVELMVVIGIIGILSAIVYANVGGASPKVRDAERQADLRNLQTAIEQYKQKNGRYPVAGCSVLPNTWAYENSCSQYIADLSPEFIATLPHDQRLTVAGTRGYSYMTNSSRTVYKVSSLNTVESEIVVPGSAFKRCEAGVICPATGVCDPASDEYRYSYALWGGYADGANDTAVKTATALVICK